MKRGSSVVVVITGLLGCSGVGRAGGLPALCEDPCTVTVTVAKGSGGRYKTTLQPLDKLRLSAAAGHQVVWNFKNESGKAMNLGVSKFTHKSPLGKPDPDWDEDPFEKGNRQTGDVAHGKSGKVQARVKKNAKAWRTYKYDILDGTTVLEDPEIEIRP